jgi:hypothetical protein
MTEQETTTTTLVCVNHPNRTTYLRCGRCNDPICPDCAVLTPTGYRCRKCVTSQQKVYNTARWYDYPLSMVIAAAIGFGGSLIASRLGFFTLFVAPIAGIIVAEAVRFVIRRRRSKRLFQAATAGAIIGGLPLLLISLLSILLSGRGSLIGLLPLVWQGLYIFLMASTAYYRLSGIRMGR